MLPNVKLLFYCTIVSVPAGTVGIRLRCEHARTGTSVNKAECLSLDWDGRRENPLGMCQDRPGS